MQELSSTDLNVLLAKSNVSGCFVITVVVTVVGILIVIVVVIVLVNDHRHVLMLAWSSSLPQLAPLAWVSACACVNVVGGDGIGDGGCACVYCAGEMLIHVLCM